MDGAHMDFAQKLTTIVGLLLALSIASERLVEIVKGMSKYLNIEKTDPVAEGRRRAVIHVIAVAAGIFTAVLAKPVVKDVLTLPDPVWLWLLALGLLSSGGSSLWNSVLTYMLQVKNLKEQVAKKVKDGKVDALRLAG
jgi:hypothetical protein